MSSLKTWLLPALIGLSLAACVELPDYGSTDEPTNGATTETTSEAASALSVSSWTAASAALPQQTYRGIQVSALNGVSYAVGAGHCGNGSVCWPATDKNNLWAFSSTNGLAWSNNRQVPGQTSSTKVSLAAFNGFLYMVHGPSDSSTTTWITRFDPATQQWSPNFEVPYTSFGGPPAIVAYKNLLYFIGTGPYPYPMWYATMTTGESFSAATPIPGHDSASRPSAAVVWGKLYFAHRWGSTADIVYGVFDGTTWGAATHIPGGDAGGTLRGLEPVIASDNGVLHLVHQRPEGDTGLVWWTYLSGCDWAGAEVSIGNQHSSQPPSLGQSAAGLVLLTTTDNNDFYGRGVDDRDVHPLVYTRPYSPFPPMVPRCNGGPNPVILAR